MLVIGISLQDMILQVVNRHGQNSTPLSLSQGDLEGPVVHSLLSGNPMEMGIPGVAP